MALTKEMVREKMKDKNTVVLNVLPRGDYDKMHIKGSHSLPWDKDPARLATVVEGRYGRDKFFITHCSGYSCQLGPDAAKALKAAGFKADDYPGGIQEWSEAGFPIEGSQVKIPTHK
ncbi:MAG TPA: rhodanese-like domain-containing protein [bacterium]|nr:rhodanese-like domain-containing protein [bacterium]